MSNNRKVLIYGASGYTGKLVAESLAVREIPFYMAGRTRSRLEHALQVVEERVGAKVDAEIVTASNNLDELVPLFEKVDVVINVAGPFMQVAWPVVEACLKTNCHYLDTTGEQDWTVAIQEKYGDSFADKGLLLSPACSYMWCAGALAAELMLETVGIDSIELLYQIDNAIPSEASTKSFLRMQGNQDSQFYLENGEYKSWPNDQAYTVSMPHRMETYLALPWGGACEPIWLKQDERVRNCKVLTAFGDEIISGVIEVIKDFNEKSVGMTTEEREALTNQIGQEMSSGEPDKDDPQVCRSVIVCHGQGQQVSKTLLLNLSAPYTFTGDICAESAQRLLNGQLKVAGFQSAVKAFGHRELLQVFHEQGFCNAVE
ncbi:MAG: saccharopine dehydrogenase [Oceanospirillales bacterium]|nr:saccharopine dehydrogenase [Oceanospirillales bacterium]MBR9887851.1 saccharopine dehydrogenase [Oceanospirillales bacterium]